MRALWQRTPYRVVLGGANLSGKSTLFRALLRLIGPTAKSPKPWTEALGQAGFDYAELSRRQLGMPRSLLLIDTPGLKADVSPDGPVRRAQAKTLQLIAQSDILVHVVDAARLGCPGSEVWPVDMELHQFGDRWSRPTVVVAAKADQVWAAMGLRRLQKLWPQSRIVAVALPSGRGLREMRAVLRELASPRDAHRARP